MDALHRATFDLWWKDDFGEDHHSQTSGSDAMPKKPTSFHIVSIFARNGSVEPRALGRFSESRLTQCIDRCDFPRDDESGMIKLPLPHHGDEWHQHLSNAELLCPKPLATTATLNIIYISNDSDSVMGMSSQTLLDLFAIFGLDYSFLLPLCRFADTWRAVRPSNGSSSFLLIIQQLYAIAYTFSPKQNVTNCLIFGKHESKVPDGLDKTDFNFYQLTWYQATSNGGDEASVRNKDRERVEQLLKRIHVQPHHLHHPLFMAQLGLVDSLFALAFQINSETNHVAALSKRASETKYKPPYGEKYLQPLVRLSHEVGEMHTSMARLFKGAGVAFMLLQTLEARSAWGKWYRKLCTEGDQNLLRLHGEAEKWLSEGLPS